MSEVKDQMEKSPSQEPEEAKEDFKPTLPAGLKQEQVDAWKKTYGVISMVRIAGCWVVYRQILQQEFVQLSKNAKTQQELLDAMMNAAVLWKEEKKSVTSAGFRNGVASVIGDLSEVNQGYLFFADEEFINGSWKEILKEYPKEKHFDLQEMVDKYDIIWVFLTKDEIYVMTYIDKEDFERIAEKNPENADDRMIQTAVKHPRLMTADLNKMPYGRYQALSGNLQVTSGFTPEQPILL